MLLHSHGYELLACLGEAPDLIFARQGGAPYQRFFLAGGGGDSGGVDYHGGDGDGAPPSASPLAERCPFDPAWWAEQES